MLTHTTCNLFPPHALISDTNGAKVGATQGIYCRFQTEHQPAENSLKGDVRHSRIRRQGGPKSQSVPPYSGVYVHPQMSDNQVSARHTEKGREEMYLFKTEHGVVGHSIL